MPTIKKEKKPAPAATEAPASPDKPSYIEAQIVSREINPEFLVLRIPDAELGWRRARLRVPRRISHGFKMNSTVRVRPIGGNVFEPIPVTFFS